MTIQEFVDRVSDMYEIQNDEKIQTVFSKYHRIYPNLNLKKLYEKYQNKQLQLVAEPLLKSMDVNDYELLKEVVVRELPISKMNAFSAKLDDGFVVIMNKRLMALIFSYHEIQMKNAQKIVRGEEIGVDYFAKLFAPILDCYLTPNSNKTLPFFDNISPELNLMVSLSTLASEMFIVAHEFAHIYLNHFDESVNDINDFLLDAVNEKREKEFAADVQASKWTINYVRNSREPISFNLFMEALVIIHLIECNLGFPDKNSSHPSALERLLNIRVECEKLLNEQELSFFDQTIMNCMDIKSFKII